MATVMTMKMNIEEGRRGWFLRIPRCFYKKDYTPTAVWLHGKIFSARSQPEQGDEEKVCRLSYEQARAELGVTAPTLSNAFGALKEKGEIKVATRDKLGAVYSCIEEYSGKKYDVIPEYLFPAEFLIEGKMRRLTNAERRLLGHIMTLAAYKKNVGAAEGSSRIFARTLNLAEKTVCSAIKVLLKAGLIYRYKEEKGINGHKRSKYRPNERLYDYKKAQKRKKEKPSFLPSHVEAANARADRERFYAQRREKALKGADKWVEKAKEDPQYRELSAALAKMEHDLAMAEVYMPHELSKLLRAQATLQRRRAENLARRGIREEWLLPVWHCGKCQDTGFLPNGFACDCYKRE